LEVQGIANHQGVSRPGSRPHGVGGAPDADLSFVRLGVIWANQPIGNLFVCAYRPAAGDCHPARPGTESLPPNRKILAISMAIDGGPKRLTETADAAGRWAIAYGAGRYALACQQDPSIDPSRFHPIP
jgi:hypothetical protein